MCSTAAHLLLLATHMGGLSVLLTMLAHAPRLSEARRHKLAEMPLYQQTCNHPISSTRTRSQTIEKRKPVQPTWSSNHLSPHSRHAAHGRPQLGKMRSCIADSPPSRSGNVMRVNMTSCSSPLAICVWGSTYGTTTHSNAAIIGRSQRTGAGRAAPRVRSSQHNRMDAPARICECRPRVNSSSRGGCPTSG